MVMTEQKVLIGLDSRVDKQRIIYGYGYITNVFPREVMKSVSPGKLVPEKSQEKERKKVRSKGGGLRGLQAAWQILNYRSL